MVQPQSTRFWHAALQSGLIDAKGLLASWEAIPEAKRTPEAIDRRLARQTVQAGFLTLWQAQQVLSGRSQGYHIDKYVLLDRIGHGGMGRVYLARDTRLNRQVALKVLSPERMNNPRALARFQREAKVGAQLQHENLVRIYDEGECSGIRYLVMEYIEGKNVGRMVAENGPLAPSAAARIARQVALGLEHAHQKGLIHRDVNPWNILITADGVAKLTDLGLAIDLGDDADTVTRDGATVGTFDYISPEQARHSRSVDTRGDIYSLGCTLYHLVTGHVPFPMPSLPEKLYAHQTSDPRPMAEEIPGVPAGLDDVVLKMMKKAPEERYATAGAVAQALEPFIEAESKVAPVVRSLATTQTAVISLPKPAEVLPTTGGSETVIEPRTQGGSSESYLSPFPEGKPDSQLYGVMPPLDFGPQEPLAQSLSGVRSKPRDEKSKPGLVANLRPWTLAAAGGVALLLAATFLTALRGCSEPGADRNSFASGSDEGQKQGGAVPVPEEGSQQDGSTSSSPVGRGPISVRWPDGTERSFSTGNAFDDLQDAIRSASARGAEVVIRGKKPLVVRATRSLTNSGGRLVIRAAKNEAPVLLVEMAGKSPFLMARADRPDSALVVDGLRIMASYSQDDEPPPPLIQAAGDLSISRCTFSTTSTKRGASVALAEGMSTKLSDTLIEGFGPAIQWVSHVGSRARLSHCIVAAQPAGDRPGGWVLAVRRGAGVGSATDRKEGRLLEVDRCTISAEGLLALDDFSEQSALSAEVKDTLVKVDALIRWKMSDAGLDKALKWRGEGNRYDIGGAAWVQLPPSGPDSIADAMPGSPSDLDSWTKLMKEEANAKVESLVFAAASTPAEAHEPQDFAPPSGSKDLGAEPTRVGPHWTSSASAEKP